MKPRLLATLVAGAGALTVFTLTAARSVTLVDSGELILSSTLLGVAHPPGFPLYTLLGFLFSRLPLGSVAFRVAWMSACCGAVGAAGTAFLVATLQERWRANGSLHGRSSSMKAPSLRWSLPAAAAGVLAFSSSHWFYAGVAEVYTLNTALLVVTLACLAAWREERHAGKTGWLWLFGAALFYGGGLAVHHVTTLLALPALLLFIRLAGGRRFLLSRSLGKAALGVLPGLATYLHLPLAAFREPLFNWGDPSSPARLLRHVAGKQYQVNFLSGDAWANLGSFFELLVRQFTWLGLPPLAAGALLLWRRDRHLALALGLLTLLNVLWTINYEIAEDTDAYYLPTFLVATLCIAAGLGWVVQRTWRHQTLRFFAPALLLLLPGVQLATLWRVADRHDDPIAVNYVDDVRASMEPGDLLLTLDWQLYAPYLYLAHVEGRHADVTVVDVNLVRRSWYVDSYLRQAYPDLMAATAGEAEAFLVRLRDWEEGRPQDPGELTRLFTRLLNAFIAFHLEQGHLAHLTLPMEPGVGAGLVAEPFGLTMRLSRSPSVALERSPALSLGPLLPGGRVLDPVARAKVRPYYASMLERQGRYLAALGRRVEAEEKLRLARRLKGD